MAFKSSATGDDRKLSVKFTSSEDIITREWIDGAIVRRFDDFGFVPPFLRRVGVLLDLLLIAWDSCLTG